MNKIYPNSALKGNFKEKTTYGVDYRNQDNLKPGKGKAHDNLKNAKTYKERTEYKDEYYMRRGQDGTKDDHKSKNNWKKMIVEHNIKSHIKNIVGTNEGPEYYKNDFFAHKPQKRKVVKEDT